MLPEYFSVDVLMERIPLANRWVSEQWQPTAVVPIGRIDAQLPTPTSGAPECVADAPERTVWRFPSRIIELHTSEAEGYFLNITSETPLVFVMWRTAEDGAVPAARPEIVTVSYNQAGRIMDGGEKVDPVPMPPDILAWMQPYVTQHYKREPRRKMKRNDPFRDGEHRRDPTSRS